MCDMILLLKLASLATVASLAMGVTLQQPHPVPSSLLAGITQYGSQTLVAEIQKLGKTYNDSADAFVLVNTSCNAILQSKVGRCTTCVTTSCKSRAQNVCKPAEWQQILAKGIGFFAQDIPKFFESSLPGFFVDTSKEVINVGGDILDFFGGTLSDTFVDVSKTIGNGVVDIGSEIGHEIGSISKTLGSEVVDIGKDIGHGVIDLGTKVLHGISDTFNKIKHLFGKRHRSLADALRDARAAEEPGCDDIKHNASVACQAYIARCHDCAAFIANTDCPGYKTAKQNIELAINARAWLKRATQLTYKVNGVTIDSSSFDPSTTGYSRVKVTVSILGKTLTFFLSQSANPYNPVTSGPVIATQAIDEFKKAQ